MACLQLPSTSPKRPVPRQETASNVLKQCTARHLLGALGRDEPPCSPLLSRLCVLVDFGPTKEEGQGQKTEMKHRGGRLSAGGGRWRCTSSSSALAVVSLTAMGFSGRTVTSSSSSSSLGPGASGSDARPPVDVAALPSPAKSPVSAAQPVGWHAIISNRSSFAFPMFLFFPPPPPHLPVMVPKGMAQLSRQRLLLCSSGDTIADAMSPSIWKKEDGAFVCCVGVQCHMSQLNSRSLLTLDCRPSSILFH